MAVNEALAEGLVSGKEWRNTKCAAKAAAHTALKAYHKGKLDPDLGGMIVGAAIGIETMILMCMTGPGHDSLPKIAKEVDPAFCPCSVLKDIFGNPFRPVAIDPWWLDWNGGTIAHLAKAVYEEKAFDQLPILADALEEAGCDSEDMLNHCRGPGSHVRGCWVVDLLLGKK